MMRIILKHRPYDFSASLIRDTEAVNRPGRNVIAVIPRGRFALWILQLFRSLTQFQYLPI